MNSNDEYVGDVSKIRQIAFTVGNLGWGIFTSITMFFQSAFLLEVAEVPDVYVKETLFFVSLIIF